jgi:hypothetical protein
MDFNKQTLAATIKMHERLCRGDIKRKNTKYMHENKNVTPSIFKNQFIVKKLTLHNRIWNSYSKQNYVSCQNLCASLNNGCLTIQVK